MPPEAPLATRTREEGWRAIALTSPAHRRRVVSQAAEGEADIRTVVDPARLKPGTNAFQIILQTVSA